MDRLPFSKVDLAPAGPGIYEIHTRSGKPLKVGISVNLRKRLKQHAKSAQNRLKLKLNGSWSNPSDVISKGSILAKHLYFDRALIDAEIFDLRTERGRQEFLSKECYVMFTATTGRESARELEKVSESKGTFRYVGIARTRDER